MTKVRSGGGRPTVYRTSEGKKVPSVTTIISRFKESGGLIRWAHKMGLDGKSLEEETDRACHVGHVVHDWIEADMLSRPRALQPEGVQMADAVSSAYRAYQGWRSAVQLEPLATEFPLVSDNLLFGGTADLLAKVAGAVCLVDWKTSNSTYPEHLVQQGAYATLLREQSRLPEPTGFVILRVGKEFGDFHHHHYPKHVLDLAAEQFELFRRAYANDVLLRQLAQ